MFNYGKAIMEIQNNIINEYPVIPQNERKQILLLCDDIRDHSGIGIIAKQFVFGTCHRFN